MARTHTRRARTIRLAMLAYTSCVTGYNKGIMLSDWTYKVLKEKVPLQVFSGVDIR